MRIVLSALIGARRQDRLKRVIDVVTVRRWPAWADLGVVGTFVFSTDCVPLIDQDFAPHA